MKYTKEVLEKVVAENQSMAGVIRMLGVRQSGGLHRHLTERVKKMGIDTSHFTGKAYLRGRMHSWGKKSLLKDLLVSGSSVRNRCSLKRRMLREGLLKNECAVCGQGPEWKGRPLVMVLDHINGVHDDYRQENLRLLCPNCNSQQDTFCGRNLKKCDDHRLLLVVGKSGIKHGALDLGMAEGTVRGRLRLLRGCAGVGKRA